MELCGRSDGKRKLYLRLDELLANYRLPENLTSPDGLSRTLFMAYD
jgi:hypothetical protein